jgi:F0F1-type ATP synthase membrane subunit c/vacuolar-type H+-ATPase subunit K
MTRENFLLSERKKITVDSDGTPTVAAGPSDGPLSTADGTTARRYSALASKIMGTLAATVGALAFGLSYSHTVSWFAHNGQSGAQSYMLAALPELLVIFCLLAVWRGDLRAPVIALVSMTLIASYALVITANIATADPGTAGLIASLVAPVSSALTLIIKLTMISDHVITPSPDPVITDPVITTMAAPITITPPPKPVITDPVIKKELPKDEVIQAIKDNPQIHTRRYLIDQLGLSSATAGRYRRAAGIT